MSYLNMKCKTINNNVHGFSDRYIKYGNFGRLLLEHFVEHKPLISWRVILTYIPNICPLCKIWPENPSWQSLNAAVISSELWRKWQSVLVGNGASIVVFPSTQYSLASLLSNFSFLAKRIVFLEPKAINVMALVLNPPDLLLT